MILFHPINSHQNRSENSLDDLYWITLVFSKSFKWVWDDLYNVEVIWIRNWLFHINCFLYLNHPSHSPNFTWQHKFLTLMKPCLFRKDTEQEGLSLQNLIVFFIVHGTLHYLLIHNSVTWSSMRDINKDYYHFSFIFFSFLFLKIYVLFIN